MLIWEIQVQAGGSFDVDYEVVGPNDKIIMDGEKERQGDFVFTATETGEYRFCFNNQMSTFAEKFVDFEIAVSSPSSHLPPFLTHTHICVLRSKTKPAPLSPLNKAHPPNKPPHSKNPSSSSQANSQPSPVTRNTSAPERTATFRLSEVRREESLTSVLLRV